MNPFRIVYVLKPAGFFLIQNFLIVIGISFGLLLWWDSHATASDYKTAKPYNLPIDKQTSLPIVNVEKLKNNKFDYNSHSFYKSSKSGLFILTGGFWGSVNYRDIVEVTSPNKNLRTFKVVLQKLTGYFPESCYYSTPNNLSLRESEVESWISSHGTYFTFPDNKVDVPSLSGYQTICKGFLALSKSPISSSYYEFGQPIQQWSTNNDTCRVETSIVGATWNDADKLYDISRSYNEADALDYQFRDYLKSLVSEKCSHELNADQETKKAEIVMTNHLDTSFPDNENSGDEIK